MDRPRPGIAVAERRLSDTVTSRRISSARRGASWVVVPAHSIRNTKGALLPSIAGTSGPFNSITTLSMAQPDRADNRCSTVPTLMSASPSSVVFNGVSMALRHVAATSVRRSVPLRRNRMPVPASAGCKVMLTLTPLCKPIPEQWIEFLSVR